MEASDSMESNVVEEVRPGRAARICVRLHVLFGVHDASLNAMFSRPTFAQFLKPQNSFPHALKGFDFPAPFPSRVSLGLTILQSQFTDARPVLEP